MENKIYNQGRSCDNDNSCKEKQIDIFEITVWYKGCLLYTSKSQAETVGDNYDKIEQVATISANNDPVIGKFIADAMRKVSKDVYKRQSRCIDKQARSDPMNFHGFRYRVGGCSRSIRDERSVLSCQSVDKRRLATVSSAEKSYVKPVGVM